MKLLFEDGHSVAFPLPVCVCVCLSLALYFPPLWLSAVRTLSLSLSVCLSLLGYVVAFNAAGRWKAKVIILLWLFAYCLDWMKSGSREREREEWGRIFTACTSLQRDEQGSSSSNMSNTAAQQASKVQNSTKQSPRRALARGHNRAEELKNSGARLFPLF